jgi:hypothetical protein
MRPIDFCTPKPSQLEHSCFAVSRRSGHLAMPFGDRAKARSRPGAARLRARPRERLFSRAAPPVRRRACRAPGSSGPPDANEAGENRASRRDSRFGNRTILTRRRFLPPCEIETPIAAGTLVASSAPFCTRRVFPFRARARRPPRPVPRGPRERRAHLRSRVPSTDRCRAHPARAGARTKLRHRHLGRGAHVMRIAEPRCHAPLLPATCSCACAPERPRWSGSRPRAPCPDWAFDPLDTGDALL